MAEAMTRQRDTRSNPRRTAGRLALAVMLLCTLGGCGKAPTSLSLRGKQLNAEQLDALAADDDIIWLDLANTNVTDEQLRKVIRMPKLGHVDLSGTSITDAGVAILAEKKDWTGLNLSRTQITDAALAQLESMPDLGLLVVGETQLSPRALMQFSEAHPGVMIDPMPAMTNATTRARPQG
ncbi:MAG: hypothetical protein GC159_12355 [Phycisphaera sp.]|nr:hypothetical protein [Phycisphaera sp.]